MDDEDDKVRRNLVMFSMAILLFAWLDVPLAAVAAKLLGDKPEGPQVVLAPWKVWSAVAALLIYLILRYRFSDEASKGFSALRADQQAAYAMRVARHLTSLASRVQGDRLAKGAFRDEIEAMIASAAERQNRVDTYSTIRPKARFALQGPTVNRGLDHNVQVMLAWEISGQKDPNLASTAIRYTMPAPTNQWLHSIAWVRAFVYSKGALGHAWPTCIASAAAVVVAYKLASVLVQ